MITRLGPSSTPRKLYGSFAGKSAEAGVTGILLLLRNIRNFNIGISGGFR